MFCFDPAELMILDPVPSFSGPQIKPMPKAQLTVHEPGKARIVSNTSDGARGDSGPQHLKPLHFCVSDDAVVVNMRNLDKFDFPPCT